MEPPKRYKLLLPGVNRDPERLVSDAEAVKLTMATPGWAVVMELIRARADSLAARASTSTLFRDHVELTQVLGQVMGLETALDAGRTVAFVGEQAEAQLEAEARELDPREA